MRHVHADMIIAKAENMDLVVFFYDTEDANWRKCSFEMMVEGVYAGCFLCLPQHKEACLHWLNGGEIQDYFKGEWSGIKAHSGRPKWNTPDQLFMNEEFELRIAPRKEKRWIAIDTSRVECLGGLRNVNVCSHAFLDKEQAEEYLGLDRNQLVEIEVEV